MTDHPQLIYIRPQRAQIQLVIVISISMIFTIVVSSGQSILLIGLSTLGSALLAFGLSKYLIKGQELVFDQKSKCIWMRNLWSKNDLGVAIVDLNKVNECSLVSRQVEGQMNQIVEVSLTDKMSDDESQTESKVTSGYSKRSSKKSRRKKRKGTENKDQPQGQAHPNQGKTAQNLAILTTADYLFAKTVYQFVHTEIHQKQPTEIEIDYAVQQKGRHYSKQILVLGLSLFFAVQMWLASSYYLGSYPWDERFSWRMFSTVRSLSCQVQLWRTETTGRLCPDGSTPYCMPVRLSSKYHMVWVNLLKRGRLQVLDRVANKECSTVQEGGGVFINLSCPSPVPPHQMVNVQSPQVNLCQTSQKRKP